MTQMSVRSFWRLFFWKSFHIFAKYVCHGYSHPDAFLVFLVFAAKAAEEAAVRTDAGLAGAALRRLCLIVVIPL